VRPLQIEVMMLIEADLVAQVRALLRARLDEDEYTCDAALALWEELHPAWSHPRATPPTIAAAVELLLRSCPTDAQLRELCDRYEVKRDALTRTADRMRALLDQTHDTPHDALRVALEHPFLLTQVVTALPPGELFAALQVLATTIEQRSAAITPAPIARHTLARLLKLPATDESWQCCSTTLRTESDNLYTCHQCNLVGDAPDEDDDGSVAVAFTRGDLHPSAHHGDLLKCLIEAMLTPMHREARRPRRIICADPFFVRYAGAALRRAGVELSFGALTGMLGHLLVTQERSAPLTPDRVFEAVIHSAPELLPALFERAAQLFERIDWAHADPALAMELVVRAPPRPGDRMIVALSGRAQGRRGIWVFYDVSSWEQWLAVGPERWLEQPLSQYNALTFNPPSALSDPLRKQLMALSLPIASPDAYPQLHDARPSNSSTVHASEETICVGVELCLMSALDALEVMTEQAPRLLSGPIPNGCRLLRAKRPISSNLTVNLSLRAPHPHAAQTWQRLGLRELTWQP
jgi:hypothetical protein